MLVLAIGENAYDNYGCELDKRAMEQEENERNNDDQKDVKTNGATNADIVKNEESLGEQRSEDRVFCQCGEEQLSSL